MPVLLPPENLTGNVSIKWKCWGEGKCPSYPAREAGCGPRGEGGCWGAGWERELLVPSALWQPPPRREACGAKPSGTPQVEDGSRSLPPFMWGSVGGGGRGGVHPK